MRTFAVVFTDEALADLRQIRRYIAEQNPEAASRIAIRLVAACDRLEHFFRSVDAAVLLRERANLWRSVPT
jgi:plasmid stabilization system protein ParE